MPFQICTRDEYGQVSILMTKAEAEEALVFVRDRVNDDNMENSLTFDEKMKDWSSYYVDVLDSEDKPVTNVVYGGKEGLSNQVVFHVSKDGVSKKILTPSDKVIFFIGFDKPTKTASIPLYAKDAKGNMIKSFKDQMLEGKTSYFIHFMK
jgi:hypothetical protein